MNGDIITKKIPWPEQPWVAGECVSLEYRRSQVPEVNLPHNQQIGQEAEYYECLRSPSCAPCSHCLSPWQEEHSWLLTPWIICACSYTFTNGTLCMYHFVHGFLESTSNLALPAHAAVSSFSWWYGCSTIDLLVLLLRGVEVVAQVWLSCDSILLSVSSGEPIFRYISRCAILWLP